MAIEAYKEAFEKARGDLENALRQRNYWTLEVAKLEQLVKSLAVVCESEVDRAHRPVESFEVGIQEIVLTCIRMADRPLSAVDIRDRIRLGQLADLSRYSNPLAVIHGALKRLEDARRIRDVKGDGKYTAIEYPSAASLKDMLRGRKS